MINASECLVRLAMRGGWRHAHLRGITGLITCPLLIPDPPDATNPSGEIGAQQTGVGCLIGETPNGAQAQIDGSRGKEAGLKVAAIAENHSSVQGQSWFRAVPIDELIDRVAVSALAVDTR
jgi:hypothetical protein